MVGDIANFNELGMPDVNFGAWFAFFAPKGTPSEALDILNQRTIAALKADSVRKLLEGNGFVIVGSSREDLGKLLISEQKRWADVVKKTGFKIDRKSTRLNSSH